MKSQPQNPEFKNNPENFHPCVQIEEHYFDWLLIEQRTDTLTTPKQHPQGIITTVNG